VFGSSGIATRSLSDFGGVHVRGGDSGNLWAMVDSGMAEHYVNVDRDTPMLLPVDMRDWVPENDLVHFVISAVDTMELGAVRVNTRGSGSKQYPLRCCWL
jgi:hypothetical protein